VGALVGAVYEHMSAVAHGCPLLGLVGVPRGELTGAVITSGVFSLKRVLAQPAMGRLRGVPSLAHLAVKMVLYLVIILFGLVVGAWCFPAPQEVGVWLPSERQDVLFSFAAVLAVGFVDYINQLLGQNVRAISSPAAISPAPAGAACGFSLVAEECGAGATMQSSKCRPGRRR
jgi:hypothetical protein